jgi:hypothetical protein
METTSKWHKFPGLSKWSPEIVPAGLPKLWTAITHECRVQSQRGLNQSCSPRRDLFSAMSHTQIGFREQVYSRLLVVGSQTASLTPGPSFAHNLGCSCPNDQCEDIFDIYVSRPFQRHQEHPNARCFGPLLWISEHSRVPEDSKSPTFPSVRLHPHTWPKWGCDTDPLWVLDHRVLGKTWQSVFLSLGCLTGAPLCAEGESSRSLINDRVVRF